MGLGCDCSLVVPASCWSDHVQVDYDYTPSHSSLYKLSTSSTPKNVYISNGLWYTLLVFAIMKPMEVIT